MIRKTYVQTEAGLAVRVTFTLPRTIWADAIYLVGEFNDWQTKSHALRQDQTGAWTLSVDLAPNRAYPFFYSCTGQWMTDNHADGYVWDTSGRNLFLVITDLDAMHSLDISGPASSGTALQQTPEKLVS
jgi:Carbohydrate-binding module 48 (Isoamylase N-terminal domain)